MQEHQPVLLEQVLQALALRPDGCYVDATYGRGGHSTAILEQLGAAGQLVVLDRDPEAVENARRRFARDPRCRVLQARFGALGAVLSAAGCAGAVNGVLLDLGLSSPQVEDPARGFSFLRDGPLDMRMDPGRGASAAQWLASASEREIARVLKKYGEEPRSFAIARAIVAERGRAPIDRTGRLAAIVAAAGAEAGPGRHPATRAFQAIRIHINQELEELEACLPQARDCLAPGGRLCVLSFHSLEDRLVKRFMRDNARVDPRLAKLPQVPPEARPRLRLAGPALRPDAAEVARNPRARSAVLRLAERLS